MLHHVLQEVLQALEPSQQLGRILLHERLHANVLVRDRQDDAGRLFNLQGSHQPFEVAVAADHAELAVLKLGKVRLRVHLVRDVGVDAFALLLRIGDADREDL